MYYTRTISLSDSNNEVLIQEVCSALIVHWEQWERLFLEILLVLSNEGHFDHLLVFCRDALKLHYLRTGVTANERYVINCVTFCIVFNIELSNPLSVNACRVIPCLNIWTSHFRVRNLSQRSSLRHSPSIITGSPTFFSHGELCQFIHIQKVHVCVQHADDRKQAFHICVLIGPTGDVGQLHPHHYGPIKTYMWKANINVRFYPLHFFCIQWNHWFYTNMCLYPYG